MYELSSYKGIKYFRQAFLFFAIAYFSRYFIIFFIQFLNIDNLINLPQKQIFDFSMLIFLYSSSMAVFSLLYSVMWKKFEKNLTKIYLFNVLGILIAIIGTFIKTREMSISINIFLLILILLVLLLAYKESKDKKGKGLLITYLLLSIFWILNIINLLLPKFLQLYKIVIYLISISLFMTILYKVLKKTGN